MDIARQKEKPQSEEELNIVGIHGEAGTRTHTGPVDDQRELETGIPKMAKTQ